ncbi:MerR family transcriptional regulator [Indiicoccus explosivorum]|uniref:MerR family transcriptional regulator n=1 Tax=Indiicoccus explosivorum TaxID=1917864 RepID=UPI000B448ED1|nr:MerR family transcriptional regulator [Indiicoccus explosivorum]
MYKVQEAAKIAGVSVRTLHHYDHIGLLKPSDVGENRYRYYSDDDLKSLQHILYFKEVGFPLKKIQEIVSNGFDHSHALSQHAELLEAKKARIEKLLAGIDRTREELAGETSLANEERFGPFLEGPDFSADRYISSPEPASAAAPESRPETAAGETDDVGAEADRIYRAIADRMDLSPSDEAIQREIAAYYRLLNRSFDCSPAAFRRLGDLYVSDSRYTASIDQHGDGLAVYLREAMLIYAEKLDHA